MTDATTIRFTEEDLRLFSEASGDRNPLHMSEAYASRTAYGERVVFGALGALAALGWVKADARNGVARLTADFHRPMFLGVDYQVKAAERADASTVRLFDGSTPVLTLSIAFTPGAHLGSGGSTAERPLFADQGPVFERPEPAHWPVDRLVPGLKAEGRWRADPALLAALCDRWHVGVEAFVGETLLWGSYFIGMEVPGRSALFFKFSLSFEAISPPSGPLIYRAETLSMDTRISQLRIGVELSSGAHLAASGQLLAFVRPELAHSNVAAELEASDAFTGKVALVIGASRGLGAATAGALALQGAEVIAMSRSAAPELKNTLPAEAAARIVSTNGDAASLESLTRLRDQIVQKYGRLDYLICNAFPAIPGLRLEPNAFSRIERYLTHATNLVLAPFCAFLELLNESGGCAVVVSSAAVESPVREWPHYVAAKSAIEGLARVAAMQYPKIGVLIVRPERLLTEMTNTPMGRQNALPPTWMAAEMIERLRNPPPAGATEVLRSLDKMRESHATGTLTH